LVAISGDAIGQLDLMFSALSGGTPTPVPVTRGSGSGELQGESNSEKCSEPVTTGVPADIKAKKGRKRKGSAGKGGKDAQSGV